jgi:hypothetical protein
MSTFIYFILVKKVGNNPQHVSLRCIFYCAWALPTWSRLVLAPRFSAASWAVGWALAHEAKVRGVLKEPRHLISGHISQQSEQRKLIHFFFFIAFFSTFPGFFFRSSLPEAGSFLSTDFVVFLFPFPFCCSGSPHRALRSRTLAARRAV